MERRTSVGGRSQRQGSGTEEIARAQGILVKNLDRTHILTRIIEAKKKRLEVSRMRVPEAIVKRMAETANPVPSFREALLKPARVRIIAEVKKASPSKGVLRESLDPAQLAGMYSQAGACAISVVTEEDFLQGDL